MMGAVVTIVFVTTQRVIVILVSARNFLRARVVILMRIS